MGREPKCGSWVHAVCASSGLPMPVRKEKHMPPMHLTVLVNTFHGCDVAVRNVQEEYVLQQPERYSKKEWPAASACAWQAACVYVAVPQLLPWVHRV